MPNSETLRSQPVSVIVGGYYDPVTFLVELDQTA
jgi:hypothetical protein